MNKIVFFYSQIICTERIKKLEVYIAKIPPFEEEKISNYFFDKYPNFKVDKDLKSLLQSYLSRSIAPDYNFAECLEEFFRCDGTIRGGIL